MKYVFFGTPKFAAGVLGSLIKAGMPPAALVCNPDRPYGRRHVITPPPTKALVAGTGVRVFQPKDKKELARMGDEISAGVDFGVVAAYAHIIPRELISRPPLGMIGVHPSLLPKYRGPSPIRSVLLDGEKKTGTTLFLIDEFMDHGPVLTQEEIPIENETYAELAEKLAGVSGALLVRTLPFFVEGGIQPQVQDESQATYTRKFSADDGFISSESLEAAEGGDEGEAYAIVRKIRALNPEPGTYTATGGKRVKLLDAVVENGALRLKRIQKAGGTPVDLP